jgi:hypothetical protein
MREPISYLTDTSFLNNSALNRLSREQLRDIAEAHKIPRGRNKRDTVLNILSKGIPVRIEILPPPPSKKSVEIIGPDDPRFKPGDGVQIAKEYEALRALALKHSLYIPTVEEAGNQVWDDTNLVEIYMDLDSDEQFIKYIKPVVVSENWNNKYGKRKLSKL